jgi:hypothetical protein
MSKNQAVTAGMVVSHSIGVQKATAVLSAVTRQWINWTLDGMAESGIARDKSGAEAVRVKIRSLLVDACLASEVHWVDEKEASMRMTAKVRKDLVETAKSKPMDVIGAVLGGARRASWSQYLSGVARAYRTGEAWTTQSHHTPAEEVAADSASSAKALDDATVKVSADKKARTVTFSAGAKSAVNADDVQSIITAITSDPGRMALALAWIKSHGWTE